jgi:glutamate-1-semialdehyde 2,1-aminomutase
MTRIDRPRPGALMADEMARFESAHPGSRALSRRSASSLLGGVPMSWMARWAGPYPVFVEEAGGPAFSLR